MRTETTSVALALACALLAGCAGFGSRTENLYFHDAGLQKRLEGARNQYRKATAADAKVADVLLANLEAAVSLEKTAIEQTQELRFRGELINVEFLTWEEVRQCAANSKCPDDPTTTRARIAGLTAQIKEATADIARLAALIEEDPDGAKTVADIKQAAVPNAVAELYSLAGALEAKLKAGNAAVRDEIEAYVGKAEDVAARAEEALDKVLDGRTDAQARLGRVLDLLRKAKDVDLIKEDAVRKQLQSWEGTAIEAGLASSLKEYTGKDFKTVGEVLSFLKTEDASLHEIRVAMLKDWRRSLVELRAADLAHQKALLKILQTQLRVADRQLEREVELARIPAPYQGPVFAGLVTLERDYRRASGADVQRIRDTIYNQLTYLGTYYERVGFLKTAEARANHEERIWRHRGSILRSQVASQARERLLAHGLDGLVSFSEGGIRYEDVAGVIGFIQTSLLAIIARKTN